MSLQDLEIRMAGYINLSERLNLQQDQGHISYLGMDHDKCPICFWCEKLGYWGKQAHEHVVYFCLKYTMVGWVVVSVRTIFIDRSV